MLIKDVYKKEYICKKCNAKIFYGKVATSNGQLVTKDGNAPNGKFGKDSNVLSAAVSEDKVTLHPCYADFVKRDYQDMAVEEPTTAVITLFTNSTIVVIIASGKNAFDAMPETLPSIPAPILP